MKWSFFAALAVLGSAVNGLSITQVTPLSGTVGDKLIKQTVVAKLDRGEAGFDFETAALTIDYKCLGEYMKTSKILSGYPCAFCRVRFDRWESSCSATSTGCETSSFGTSLTRVSSCMGPHFPPNDTITFECTYDLSFRELAVLLEKDAFCQGSVQLVLEETARKKLSASAKMAVIITKKK